MPVSQKITYIAAGLALGIILSIIIFSYVSIPFQRTNTEKSTETQTLVTSRTVTDTTTITKSTTLTETQTTTLLSTITRTQTITTTWTRYITKTQTNYVTVTKYVTLTVTKTVTPNQAEIIPVDLKFEDHRPLFGTPSLIITGYLVNIGNRPAYNVVLHVVFYQGNVKTEKDIIIGTIGPKEWIRVDESISYVGEKITNVKYTIKWS